MDNSFDEMIKEYSDELMNFARRHNTEALVIKEKSAQPINAEREALNGVTFPQEEADENEESIPLNDESSGEVTEIPAEEDMENFAYFRARVFTGGEAYPIEKAGVTVYKNDILYAFLVTDKNGETAKIKIEAYPERNSLEPLSDEQSIDYTADVFAEGFTRKENLLVSAVGGSDIVLETELTPESEGIT